MRDLDHFEVPHMLYFSAAVRLMKVVLPGNLVLKLTVGMLSFTLFVSIQYLTFLPIVTLFTLL